MLIERLAQAMAEDRDGDTWDVKSEDGDGHGYMGKNDYRRLAEVAIQSIFAGTRATEYRAAIVLVNPDWPPHYWDGHQMVEIKDTPSAWLPLVI